MGKKTSSRSSKSRSGIRQRKKRKNNTHKKSSTTRNAKNTTKSLKSQRLTFARAWHNSSRKISASITTALSQAKDMLQVTIGAIIAPFVWIFSHIIDLFRATIRYILIGGMAIISYIAVIQNTVSYPIIKWWQAYQNERNRRRIQIVQQARVTQEQLIQETEGRIIQVCATKTNPLSIENNSKEHLISRALVLVPSPESELVPLPKPRTLWGKLWALFIVTWAWVHATIKWASVTILRILLVGIILVILVGMGVFYYLYVNAPDITTMMAASRIAETTIIYDRTGDTVLYEIHGEENRKRIDHDDIPDVMRMATIAAEDDAFYTHIGIDPFSIARSVKENLLQGRLAQGGSTITQQLARNIFLTRDKTIERKVREAVLAIKIERMYTKDEILNAYLNVIPYGMNTYGIQTASEVYFGKNARDLTLDEAALLASLPKATATFSPYGSYTNRLIARQKMILERMRELALADNDAIDDALRIDTLDHVQPFRQRMLVPHFTFAVIEQLEEQYGRELLERGGLRVMTTIDLEKQTIAEDVITRGVARNVRWGAENAALVAIDPRTGEVLSMVGSKNYYAKDIDGKVNVTTRLRQPGSSFKPLAYAAAFEKGYQPETLLWDVRTNFGSDGSGKAYIPQNYTGRFHGLVSMRTALAQSLNIPAVKTLYLADIDKTIEVAHRLGITSLNERSRYGLALVLGGAEVKLVDLTAAYGVFANDGVRAPVRLINTIANRDGETIYDAQLALKIVQVLRPDVAQKINSILSDNVARTPAFGRNNPLVIPGHTVAAKTGTTQNYRDAWTMGYTPELAVGVWVGNNSGRWMYPGAAGTYAAAPIWNDFMTQMLTGTNNISFTEYQKVQSSVPMVAGVMPRATVIRTNVIGAKADKKDRKKEKTRIIYHSILYYIDKNTPLTGAPANHSDPMLRRWEAGLFGNAR